MRALLTVCTLITLLAVTAVAEPPPPLESCCACVGAAGAQTSGKAPTPAFFCDSVISEEERIDFGARCSGAGGSTVCVVEAAMGAQADSLNCSELLAGENILCPANKPVPAAGQPLLIGLALLLAGVGVWAARRTLRR